MPSEAKAPFEPLHPAFIGKAEVVPYADHRAKILQGLKYQVNLSTGTCNCKSGGPEQWHEKHQTWVPNLYCTHKLRVISDIIEEAGRPSDMIAAYAKALASRYNRFEVVSAFHKELRRGDVEKAIFWGTVLSDHRKPIGIVRYLFNIMFEETRDWTLALSFMLMLRTNRVTYPEMNRAIEAFCKAPKKWQLKGRLAIFQDEMAGYQLLVDEFGRDVAKGSLIIPEKLSSKLEKAMLNGLKTPNRVQYQYGLKGLQKIKLPGVKPESRDLNERLSVHRSEIANALINAASPATEKRKGFAEIIDFLTIRGESGLGIGYHELNAFADFLSGEPFAFPPRSATVTTPAVLRLGVMPPIPKYAHDNHTWAGKAALRRYPREFLPGATQEHFDLRLCGAYMGVGWRYLAYDQHQSLDVPWGSVKWPKGLHETVSQLWY